MFFAVLALTNLPSTALLFTVVTVFLVAIMDSQKGLLTTRPFSPNHFGIDYAYLVKYA